MVPPMTPQPQNPDYRQQVEAIFSAPFVAHLGIEFVDCGPGWCETQLVPAAMHLQQDGYVHAGVQATLADHTAGAAAGTLMRADELVLSVEFKIQLLRPAKGALLRCRSDVLRPGRRISAVEAVVHALPRADARDDEAVMVSKLTATMALLERR